MATHTLASLTTPSAIASVALPSLVTTLAPPATVALELALLARDRGGAADAGAFTAVLTTAALVTSALNFLTVGVAAQVGAAVGARAFRAAAARVRVAVGAALAFGFLGATLLLAVGPAARQWLRLEAAAAPRFWVLRSATVPSTLLLSAVTGSLNGYGDVLTAAVITGGAAAAEALAVGYLFWRGAAGSEPLVTVGAASLAVSLAAAVLGLLVVRGAMAAHAGDEASGDSGDAHLLDGTPPPSLRSLILDFLRGGSAMFVRSMTLQLTFNAALAVAARQGTAALAAHAAAAQLWLATSYTADSLESAAVVLGSRIAAVEDDRAAAKRAFKTLARRLLTVGVAIGGAAAAVMALEPRFLARVFLGTTAPAATDLLLHRTLAVVAAAQPLCAATFVSDGLVYATRDFGGARDVMVASFALLFAPALAIGNGTSHGVWFIWLAKALHNAGRLVGNLWVVVGAWR